MRTHIRAFPLALLLPIGVLACDDVNVTASNGDLKTEELVDFGDVQLGIVMPFELTVENKGDGIVRVHGIQLADTFVGTDYEFKLSTQSLTVRPNEPEKLTITFQAFAAMEQPVESSFTLLTDQKDSAGNDVSFTVRVRARGVTSGLEVVPNPVDFGKVLIGSTKDLEVRITNRLSVAVDITTRLGGDGRPEITNQGGLGRFELLTMVAADRGGSLLEAGSLLEPEASITVTIRYIPDPSQDNRQDRGRWTISNCANPLCDLDIVLLGTGTNTAIECLPPTVDFGQVNPGVVMTQATTCTNVASDAVTVTGWTMGAGSAPEYSVAQYNGSPASLAAGASFELEVEFAPTLGSIGTSPVGSVVIEGRNPRANRDLTPTRVELTGIAGGPDISVLPEQLNFGQTAIGTSNKKRLLVENTGYNDLLVEMIAGDVDGTGVFSANRTAFSVAAGDSEIIEVTFTPNTMGVVTSAVLISSNDTDEAEVRIPIQGEGIQLPPCNYTVTPTEVNFGIVQVLRTTTQGLQINNVGTNDCLINDIAIAAGSSGAFGLVNGEETGVILAPGQTKTVIIEYTPARETVDDGILTFYISDPNNSNPEVALRGVGSASALLISPNEVDFGRIGVGCSTRERTITIYNTGSAVTVIERIELPAGITTEFALVNPPGGIPSPPGAGASIQPGQSIEFAVRYHANDIGQDTGFFHIFERGKTDPYVIPLYGEGATDPTNEDRFEQLETPEVDILFVIDNSCSMSEEQASLGSNFQSFIQFATSQALDYQLGVVTTDIDGANGCTGAANRPLGEYQGACGYLADGNGDGTQGNVDWRIITPDEEPSPETAFGAIVTQGTDGSASEAGLHAAYLALSSPIVTGWNQGFLRPDAYLAIIFVSDEEDQSPNTVDFYVNFFLAIKGFRNTNLFSASSIVGDVPNGCGNFGADAGERYVEAANRTGGIFESICTTDWAQALQNLGLSVFGYKSRFFLSNQPVAGTVEVRVDGVLIEGSAASGQVRWSYDPATNSINFAPLAIPEPGSEIVVTYVPECL